jgi:hypothetical protein
LGLADQRILKVFVSGVRGRTPSVKGYHGSFSEREKP